MKVTKDDVFEAAMAFWNADMDYTTGLTLFRGFADKESTDRMKELYQIIKEAYLEFFRIAKAFDEQEAG